jgi:hypothetical protein
MYWGCLFKSAAAVEANLFILGACSGAWNVLETVYATTN